MVNDPLLSFLSSLSNKIKIEKEHRDIIKKIEESPAQNIKEESKDPLASALNILKDKIVQSRSSQEIPSDSQQQPAVTSEITQEEKDNFADFIVNLKSIISNKKTEDEVLPEHQGGVIEDAAIENKNNSEKPALEEIKTESDQEQKIDSTQDYVGILDQLSDEVASVKEPEKVSEIKKLIEQYAEKYFKKAAIMSEYAGGGGTNAVQFANGGVMNGDLNVNGNYLSGGVNLLDIFSGGGGGGGDPAVNTAVYAGSASWNSNFTTTNYFSSFWNAAVDELFNFYVTQTDPGSAFISEDGNYYIIANSKLDNVDLWNSAYTQTFLLSSQWSSVYVTVLGLSARWESVYTTFNQNSAKYESAYSSVASNSGSWSSVYNTYNALSASYASETLAIAYAVAL
jgi:hypothetical protein